jgi:hypothetical protein
LTAITHNLLRLLELNADSLDTPMRAALSARQHALLERQLLRPVQRLGLPANNLSALHN